jgi:hypothetical protein
MLLLFGVKSAAKVLQIGLALYSMKTVLKKSDTTTP